MIAVLRMRLTLMASLSCRICSVLTSLAILKTVTSGKDGKVSYEVENVAKECSCSVCISLDYLHIYNTVSQVWHHWNQCSHADNYDIGPCRMG